MTRATWGRTKLDDWVEAKPSHGWIFVGGCFVLYAVLECVQSGLTSPISLAVLFVLLAVMLGAMVGWIRFLDRLFARFEIPGHVGQRMRLYILALYVALGIGGIIVMPRAVAFFARQIGHLL